MESKGLNEVDGTAGLRKSGQTIELSQKQCELMAGMTIKKSIEDGRWVRLKDDLDWHYIPEFSFSLAVEQAMWTVCELEANDQNLSEVIEGTELLHSSKCADCYREIENRRLRCVKAE